MLPICLSAIWLSGCKEPENFWTPTYQKIEELKNDEKYAFLTSNMNLSYTDFIENSNLSHTLKEVYEPIYKNLLFEFNSLCDVFSVKPILLNDKNSKEIKNKFESLQKQLDSIKQSANEFLNSKQKFESHFKRQYLNQYKNGKRK